MSGLWVAVTAEFDGSIFSHRAEAHEPPLVTRDRVLHPFNYLVDDAASCVRSGLAGWLPPQVALSDSGPSSEYEKLRKLREIRKILDASSIGGQEIIDIYEVLNR